MAEISAALVKELREKTGAGMMDCKKALAETGGDFERAVDSLRKKGLAAAAKKAGRVASDGLVGAVVKGAAGALVEVNSETDFVARTEGFQSFSRAVAEAALACDGDLEAIKARKLPSGRTVADELTHLVATIGENMTLRRAAAVKVGQGVVASYVHGQVSPGLGRIGVLVALESTGDAAKLAAFGKQVAMHIAHANPEALEASGLDQARVERERNIFAEQARASGKPEDIVQKMIDGRLRKFYQEVVLLEQDFVHEQGTSVSKALQAAAKDAGAPIRIAGYLRFALGEGIDKPKTDLAGEVAQLTT